MATATRVKQPATRLPRFKKAVVQTTLITEVDGKETDRIVGPRQFQPVPDGYDEIARPDRVTLDLSLEEAQTLFTVVGNVAGAMDGPRGHTEAIYRALNKAGVLYVGSKQVGLVGHLTFPLAVSPVKDTPASSVGGGCSPVDPMAGQMKHPGTATTGSGYPSDRARRDAEKQALVNELLYGKW